MPITRRYPLSGGRQAGELRFPAPRQTTWFHGTNDAAANSIVRQQMLYGDGDFGSGGYLAASQDLALDWTHTDPDTYKSTGSSEDYPGLVVAELHPKRPWYGGEVKNRDNDAVLRRLREQGNDVWFPLEGATPRNPGGYAVLLDSNASRSANFTKGKLDYWTTADYDEDYDED